MATIKSWSPMILCLLIGWSLWWSFPVVVSGETAGTNYSEEEQQEALANLKYLTDFYDISLDDNGRQIIVNLCQEVIWQDLTILRDAWQKSRQDYDQTLNIIHNSLRQITHDLRHMKEDSSAINLATIKLQKVKTQFESAAEVYDTSIEQIVILGDRCQQYPRAFLAGLYEANNRRQLAQVAAKNLDDFINNDLMTALANLQERLLILED